MLIRIADSAYPLTLENVGIDHPTKAIPPTVTSEDLLTLGYAYVVQTPAPAIDQLAQQVTEGAPLLVDGTYQRTWVITDLSEEALTEQIAGQKTLLLSQIEQLRDSKRYADVSAHGRMWQADPISRGLLIESILFSQLGGPLPTVWRDVDNNNMPISSIQDLTAIAIAMAIQTNDSYLWSFDKKEEIKLVTQETEKKATLTDLFKIDLV